MFYDQRDVDIHYGRCPDCGDVRPCGCHRPPPETPAETPAEAAWREGWMRAHPEDVAPF